MVDRFFLATKAVIVDQGDVLILQEAAEYEDGTNAGKWQIPGGRLEPGEQPEEALQREVAEEAGLEVTVNDPFHVDEWRPEVDGEQWQIVGVFFECSSDSRDVDVGEEHTDYAWIDPAEHHEHDLIENLHDVFEAFLER